MSSKKKYTHTTRMHNMIAPRLIVKKLLEYYKPKSVVDFGCGLGTFLKAFKEEGVNEVLGLDGPWVNRELLKDFLSEDEFLEVDLEQENKLNKKYDLVISLEVAEHLSESKASVFVNNLVNAGNVILFSAAVPFQGGQNHINEQWVEYWQDKFEKHNYKFYDIFRRPLWNEEDIKWWYKQNMFLIVSENKEGLLKNTNKDEKIINLIHPEHFELKSRLHLDFRLGKSRPQEYLKLFIKSILYRLKILK